LLAGEHKVITIKAIAQGQRHRKRD